MKKYNAIFNVLVPIGCHGLVSLCGHTDTEVLSLHTCKYVVSLYPTSLHFLRDQFIFHFSMFIFSQALLSEIESIMLFK
jgi:hypothetical protein